MKKIVSLLLIVSLFIVAGCGGNTPEGTNEMNDANGTNENANESANEQVEVSVLMGKPEVAQQFEAMVEQFNNSQDEVNVTVVPLAGQNAFEKMTALYSSGNAPTMIMMGKEFPEFQDKLLDLSDQPWVEHVTPGTTDFVTVDGKIYGMPVTVEAFGFIYNQSVLDKAVGGTFDPSTVRTHDELKALFQKVEAVEGVEAAFHISPMDWSLGAHFSNIMFTTQSSEREARHQFLEDMKAGKVNLQENAKFQGWLDTFDLMIEHNSAKKSPLAPKYDDGPLALASGKVGLWFMGNWALPQLQEANPEAEFGFLPVPISNNPDDYGNQQISVGVPSYWVVDASQSTPEQQEGANQFLNWLVGSEEGQKGYVNKLGFIPVFDNFKSQPKDSLSQSVTKYMQAENTLEWMNSYYPPDGSAAMGASLQKYLSGVIDRAGLAKEFTEYWESKE